MESEICPVCRTAAKVTKVRRDTEELYCDECKEWHFYGRLRKMGTGGGRMRPDNVTYVLDLIYQGNLYVENYKGDYEEVLE